MDDFSEILKAFRSQRKCYELFLDQVSSAFRADQHLNTAHPPIIHSIRQRIKDEDHLIKKIKRKQKTGRSIDHTNIFNEITDIAGVRVLHLFQDQFSEINSFIESKIKRSDWRLVEPPVAYSWDPESKELFEKLGIRTEIRPTYYTSIHYVVSPANDQDGAACEIQVRTLFEEIWGEVDHSINYPTGTDSIACKEQLRVLSKLVSTGTRLTDAIFRVHRHEHRIE